MGVLKILMVVFIGILVCIGIITFSCFYVAGQIDQVEELEHPERIEMR